MNIFAQHVETPSIKSISKENKNKKKRIANNIKSFAYNLVKMYSLSCIWSTLYYVTNNISIKIIMKFTSNYQEHETEWVIRVQVSFSKFVYLLSNLHIFLLFSSIKWFRRFLWIDLSWFFQLLWILLCGEKP